MTEKRFTRISVCGDWGVKDTLNDKVLFFGTTEEVIDTVELLNMLHEQNERLRERLQIKDYALQKQSEITENQQRRIKELEDQLQKLRKTVNKQYVTWREWE